MRSIISRLLAILSYNPCFSGSSSATIGVRFTSMMSSLSYNPCFSGSSSATQQTRLPQPPAPHVTILVFLAALVQLAAGTATDFMRLLGYNPCFSGSSSATEAYLTTYSRGGVCYNPCFSGSSSATYEIVS